MEEDNAVDVEDYGRDVIIYLMPNSFTEFKQDNAGTTRKCKRKAEYTVSSAGWHDVVPLCEIKANSTRLLQCCKYFEPLMSGRWIAHTQRGQSIDATKTFYLEVQTEERFYHDCFSRMFFLHQPIRSVKHCIELLKVASQIEYRELMDTCLQCLATIPWSCDEREQIRAFCESGHEYVSSDSAADLHARLQLPLAEKEMQREVGGCLQRTLRRYLSDCFDKRFQNREMFEKTFHAIVSASVSGNMGPNVLQFALTLVKNELERLWSSVKRCSQSLPYFDMEYCIEMEHIKEHLADFMWLFQVLREVNAAQGVVEVILKDGEVSQILLEASMWHELTPCSSSWLHRSKWYEVHAPLTEVIIEIFEDVLSGHLFLKHSDRMTLLKQWKWLLHRDLCFQYMSKYESQIEVLPSGLDVEGVFARMIMSFPLSEQEEICSLWLGKTCKDHCDTIYESSVDYRGVEPGSEHVDDEPDQTVVSA